MRMSFTSRPATAAAAARAATGEPIDTMPPEQFDEPEAIAEDPNKPVDSARAGTRRRWNCSTGWK